MFIESYPLKLTPEHVHTTLRHQHGLILRDVINPGIARAGHASLKELISDREFLQEHPYDPETRLGYTAPGVEALQRDPTHPDQNRAMFDFRSGDSFRNEPIAALYEAAVRSCRLILGHLGCAYSQPLTVLPEGKHTLRTAQYLRKGTTSVDVLFPRHRDFSLLTAFIGFDVAGLEAEVSGNWRPVELGYGDVLVGVGTPLTQFYPDLQPLWHRIVGGMDYRLSAFLFFELGDEVVLPKTQEQYGMMLRRVLGDIRVAA